MLSSMPGREFICAISVDKGALMIKLACEILDVYEILPTELGRSLNVQSNTAE